jgi:hypothetical protein
VSAGGLAYSAVTLVSLVVSRSSCCHCTGGHCQAWLQYLVDSAAHGTVLDVPACVYREHTTVGKQVTLDAPGTEFRSNDVWTR